MESEKQAKKKDKFRLCIEVSVLGVIVLVLWGLMSLPIVFYNMPTTFTRNTSQVSYKILFSVAIEFIGNSNS